MSFRVLIIPLSVLGAILAFLVLMGLFTPPSWNSFAGGSIVLMRKLPEGWVKSLRSRVVSFGFSEEIIEVDEEVGYDRREYTWTGGTFSTKEKVTFVIEVGPYEDVDGDSIEDHPVFVGSSSATIVSKHLIFNYINSFLKPSKEFDAACELLGM